MKPTIVVPHWCHYCVLCRGLSTLLNVFTYKFNKTSNLQINAYSTQLGIIYKHILL